MHKDMTQERADDLLPEFEMIDLRIELDTMSQDFAYGHDFPAIRYYAQKYFDMVRSKGT